MRAATIPPGRRELEILVTVRLHLLGSGLLKQCAWRGNRSRHRFSNSGEYVRLALFAAPLDYRGNIRLPIEGVRKWQVFG